MLDWGINIAIQSSTATLLLMANIKHTERFCICNTWSGHGWLNLNNIHSFPILSAGFAHLFPFVSLQHVAPRTEPTPCRILRRLFFWRLLKSSSRSKAQRRGETFLAGPLTCLLLHLTPSPRILTQLLISLTLTLLPTPFTTHPPNGPHQSLVELNGSDWDRWESADTDDGSRS